MRKEDEMRTKTLDGRRKIAAARITLHRETLRQLTDSDLQRAAGQKLTNTCGTCTGGTGVTCSGWPPCTC